MNNKELIGVSRSLVSGSGQPKVAAESLELVQKLQALTDENVYLERRLEVMVANNRVLQSMRSRKPSFKC